MPWPQATKFVADAKLPRGACHAEGGDFGIISTLEHQLTETRQCFLEGLEDAQVERRNVPTEDQTMRRFPDRRETA